MPVTSTPVPHKKRALALVSGAPPQRLTPFGFLHFLYIFLPRIFVTLPISILWKYTIGRRSKTGVVSAIGRPVFADIVLQLTRYLFERGTVAELRLLFNRKAAYDMIYAGPQFYGGYKKWVEYVTVNGTTGRWFAPPGTKRSDDDVVLYFVHGGGFVMDTGGNSQIFMLNLVKEMNLNRKVQFSIFSLDYELAPEFKYPSQLIETLAGYHYLVNNVGIPEHKICLSGDSAGGNLASAFLLHLARPHPRICVPKELGPTPKRPGSALLISPFVKLVSSLNSRYTNEKYDFIGNKGAHSAALDYIGAKRADKKVFIPSWNPLHLVTIPGKLPPKSSMPPPTSNFDYKKEGTGLGLFASPYVNPSVCHDMGWWKEACPPEGRTMVVWGGKEIFNDDVVEFVSILEQAGVAPATLCKPYGVHDWLLYDHYVPGISTDHAFGPEGQLRFGVDNVASFLQDIDITTRAKVWDEYSIKKHGARSSTASADGAEAAEPSTVADPLSEEMVEEKGETDSAEVERVGDSVVIVGEHSGGKESKKKVGKGKK